MCQNCDPYGPASALAVMHNTGPARLDSDGCIVESGEYVAAMYESYAADREWADGDLYVTRPKNMPVATWYELHPRDYTIVDYGEALQVSACYAAKAERLAEELWQRDVEEVAGQQIIRYPWQDPNCPHPEFHNDPQHMCP